MCTELFRQGFLGGGSAMYAIDAPRSSAGGGSSAMFLGETADAAANAHPFIESTIIGDGAKGMDDIDVPIAGFGIVGEKTSENTAVSNMATQYQ